MESHGKEECVTPIFQVRWVFCSSYHDEMELVNGVQTLDAALCISLLTNALWKIINQSILLPAMGK